MENNIKLDRLIIPVYINEKIVLDMLAIIEDGFSMVSQINYTEHKESSSAQKVDAGISTSAPILSKFLKIDVSGGLSHEGNKGENENVIKEKVHTNDSLLSIIWTVLLICFAWQIFLPKKHNWVTEHKRKIRNKKKMR